MAHGERVPQEKEFFPEHKDWRVARIRQLPVFFFKNLFLSGGPADSEEGAVESFPLHDLLRDPMQDRNTFFPSLETYRME